MTDGAIQFIEKHIMPTDTVIEWGGGGVVFFGQNDVRTCLQWNQVANGVKNLSER